MLFRGPCTITKENDSQNETRSRHSPTVPERREHSGQEEEDSGGAIHCRKVGKIVFVFHDSPLFGVTIPNPQGWSNPETAVPVAWNPSDAIYWLKTQNSRGIRSARLQ